MSWRKGGDVWLIPDTILKKKKKQFELTITEYRLQKQISTYIRRQYPEVMFRADLGGTYMTVGQRNKMLALQDGRKWPDLYIFEPKGGYHGLIIEIKKNISALYKADGITYKSKHIVRQAETLALLREKGYLALFGYEFEGIKKLIDEYLAGRMIKT